VIALGRLLVRLPPAQSVQPGLSIPQHAPRRMSNVTLDRVEFPLQRVCEDHGLEWPYILTATTRVIQHHSKHVQAGVRPSPGTMLYDLIDSAVMVHKLLMRHRLTFAPGIVEGAPAACVLGIAILWLIWLYTSGVPPLSMHASLEAGRHSEVAALLRVDWVFVMKRELHRAFFGLLQLIADHLSKNQFVADGLDKCHFEAPVIVTTGGGALLRRWQGDVRKALSSGCSFSEVLLSSTGAPGTRWLERLAHMHPLRMLATSPLPTRKRRSQSSQAAGEVPAVNRREGACQLDSFCNVEQYASADDAELLTCASEPPELAVVTSAPPVAPVATGYSGGVLRIGASIGPGERWTAVSLVDLTGATGPADAHAAQPTRRLSRREVYDADRLRRCGEGGAARACSPRDRHDAAELFLGWEGVALSFSGRDRRGASYNGFHISPQQAASAPGRSARRPAVVRKTWRPSLYVILHDAWSRAVFDTKMPRTREFLATIAARSPHAFFELRNLHTQADARTVQNELPLFTGKNYDFRYYYARYLNSSCPETFLEGQPLLWTRLRAVGYRTAYGATHCNGIFGYRRCPVVERTFRHLAPFPHEDSMCAKSLNPDELYPFTFMCKGRRRVFEHYHRYFEQLWRQYSKAPKFAWFQFNLEHMRMPELNALYDARLRGHLRRLLAHDRQGRSVVLLLGDHGPRGGCDEANPGLWLVAGRAVLRRHPRMAAALRGNRDRLASMLDVHQTLLGILGLRELASAARNSQPRPERNIRRVDRVVQHARDQSAAYADNSQGSGKECRNSPCDLSAGLVSFNRTCAETLVHPLYCNCVGAWQGRDAIKKDRMLAWMILEVINTDLKLAKSHCAYPLRLLRVPRVRTRYFPAHELHWVGDLSRALSVRKQFEVVDFDFDTEAGLSYRIKAVYMDVSDVSKYKKSLACQFALPIHAALIACVAQLSALHRYAKFEPCTPPAIDPQFCLCPPDALIGSVGMPERAMGPNLVVGGALSSGLASSGQLRTRHGTAMRRCREPLFPEALPTLLHPDEAEAWSAIEMPGQAPWEARMELISAHWDKCDSRGGSLWEVLASEVPGGLSLCVPHACTEHDIKGSLWPRYFRRTVGFNASSDVAVLQLGHWRELKLDFVLAGFEKCGTSSLSHNLARHLQVEFVPAAPTDPRVNTDAQEAQDGHVFWFAGGRLLPPAELVAAFNKGTCCSGGARVVGVTDSADKDATRAHQPTAPILARGERNPVYVFHRAIMKMIMLVSHAKVLLVACDPIGWLHSAYTDTTNWYDSDIEKYPPPPLRAFASMDVVVAPRPSNLSRGGLYNLSRQRALFTRMLKGLTRLFGRSAQTRIHLVHRDSLDERLVGKLGVRQAYDRIAGFLGIVAFPPSFLFERRNVAGKKMGQGGVGGSADGVGRDVVAPRGSGLCAASDALALASLRRYFRSEYKGMPSWLVRFGSSVPPRVASNLSYCDP